MIQLNFNEIKYFKCASCESKLPKQVPEDKTEVEGSSAWYAFSETVRDWLQRKARDIAKLGAAVPPQADLQEKQELALALA